MLEPFDLPFVQRGLIMLVILAVPAGLLGCWIVLRGLTFFSHAIGTASFPGLVLAGGVGFSPILGSLGAAAAFATGTGSLKRSTRSGSDVLTALALVAFLALGVLLASDVFTSGANIDQMLFGSLFLIGSGEIAVAALAAALTLLASAALGPRWLTSGFDPQVARNLGAGGYAVELTLLGLIALTTAAMLPAIGVLLVGALFVVPAASVRLFTNRLWKWQLASILLVLAEGVVGLRLSLLFDAPPGPVIAALSAGLFALAALTKTVARAPSLPIPASLNQ
jgi:ABC-type Mn2+/Zn2+ transport system permease subunit